MNRQLCLHLFSPNSPSVDSSMTGQLQDRTRSPASGQVRGTKQSVRAAAWSTGHSLLKHHVRCHGTQYFAGDMTEEKQGWGLLSWKKKKKGRERKNPQPTETTETAAGSLWLRGGSNYQIPATSWMLSDMLWRQCGSPASYNCPPPLASSPLPHFLFHPWSTCSNTEKKLSFLFLMTGPNQDVSQLCQEEYGHSPSLKMSHGISQPRELNPELL